MLTENATALLAEFKKKYPFIDTSLYRANTQKLLPKIQLEARTQQHQADVISATFTIWNELTRGKLIMKYDSPERAKFPADLKDAEGYWNIVHLGVQGMAYNTKLVAPDIAPKSYEDLLHPRWRPKQIAMDYRDSSWMAVMLEIMGEAEGIAFMKKLAAKDLYMRENKNLLTQLLAAGEFPVLANTYLETFAKIQKAGAPIEWVAGQKSDSRFDPSARHLRACAPSQCGQAFRRFFAIARRAKLDGKRDRHLPGQSRRRVGVEKKDRRLSPPPGQSQDDVALRRDQQTVHGNILEKLSRENQGAGKSQGQICSRLVDAVSKSAIDSIMWVDSTQLAALT